MRSTPTSRFGWWFHSPPAPQPTSSPACWRTRCRSRSASSWWGTTRRAPTAPSPPPRWRRPSPPYDPVADFTPITDIGRYTFFILVHPSVPAKTLAELIDHARANPGKLNYATGNTTSIVSTAYFASLAGIQLVHVPYKGEPQAVTDLVAGRVQLMFCSSSTSIAQIR